MGLGKVLYQKWVKGKGHFYHIHLSEHRRQMPHSLAAWPVGEAVFAWHPKDTEFTLRIYISATDGFDANQTYRLRFDGMSYRMSAGSPATATITINANP